jgi:DNA-binding XRE family transcriptional regulator
MQSPEMVAAAADTSDPRAGLRAVSSLRLLVETLELRQVEAALRAGMGWQEVADALGVSRQAVHKKYAKRIDPSIDVPRRTRR